jgi:phage/plasmid-associated DNA primase
VPVRFEILTNELPRLQDAAGALVARTIILQMTHSFIGREDRGLDRRLQAELPGILNWSIAGLRRYWSRGSLLQPASGQQLLDDLADLASPIGQFVKESCDVGPGRCALVSELFDAWRMWCEQNGREHPGTKQTFGRDLTAAIPGLKTSQPWVDGKKVRRYEGIGLRGFGTQWNALPSIARVAREQSNEEETDTEYEAQYGGSRSIAFQAECDRLPPSPPPAGADPPSGHQDDPHASGGYWEVTL